MSTFKAQYIENQYINLLCRDDWNFNIYAIN